MKIARPSTSTTSRSWRTQRNSPATASLRRRSSGGSMSRRRRSSRSQLWPRPLTERSAQRRALPPHPLRRGCRSSRRSAKRRHRDIVLPEGRSGSRTSEAVGKPIIGRCPGYRGPSRSMGRRWPASCATNTCGAPIATSAGSHCPNVRWLGYSMR